ncbi:actin-like ATPase domain-containing protein [Guyanagaster necrorhizus]|uniref:Actin-like ATPase domain-containing protein n=1 Tax=Guyanagaster necrorhizus TaxID=856835 RepID=A0A9P8ARH7_9AGAR|nr:actin-like ATPase domain-containing protein [Guyanagaster necrorhizus MCA 3950]KAG7444906.1 actin-like ATPase domain-containing protein [Guyanagaster necrorhizus MCA 3950]
MPRGIPNVKRDDTGLRYTSFNIPLPPNPKHLGTTYLKSDTQTVWYRNSIRKSIAPSEDTNKDRRGTAVLVIHPGSRFLRVGRASDVTPVAVPNVIARKTTPTPTPVFVKGISRPQKGRHGTPSVANSPSAEDNDSSEDPFEEKLSAIIVSLRDRMRFYKLRVTPNAANLASTFNAAFQPEIIPEHNDPFQVEWVDESCSKDVLVGEKALLIADPQRAGYSVKWPIYGPNFNTRDYSSLRVLMGDIEMILRQTLRDKLNINQRDYGIFSVILLVPDFYDRSYVREWVNMLLVGMGFKQLCAQQESLAATYGAGVSNACVVNIGAKSTSLACVDEGLVIADSRMNLNLGGDDITEFLYVLLERIGFPYRDIDLSRAYDWNIMEDLKSRLCTLTESVVALNLYDFVVRRPGKPTEKYGLRAYDEIILAPMCLFEPRVIDFDRKRVGFQLNGHLDVTEDVLEIQGENVTSAMMISTQHLLPSPTSGGPPIDSQGNNDVASVPAPQDSGAGTPMDVDSIEDTNKGSGNLPQPMPLPDAPEPIPPPSSSTSGDDIDVCFEASKLPLDVAIFNSARASGGDDKIRKYLQAVLVIGGGALVPGMAHALESRLQAIATPLVVNMEKVQILAPPKEVDPRVLAWKGAAVLGKMDGSSELWVTPADWDILGMRGLKERCFFL